MIIENKINNESGAARFFLKRNILGCIFTALLLMLGQFTLLAQQGPTFTQPSWWYGAAGGANFNFHRGSTQQLNADVTTNAALHDGFGLGLYLAPTIEYYQPNSMWGMIFQFGYDSRRGQFKETFSPCDCPLDLSTELSYITIEPSLRFAPARSDFYLYAGPRIAFPVNQSFEFQQKANPAFPDQEPGPMLEGDFDNIKQIIVSMQIGAGYDIQLSAANKRTQWIISPFVSFQPYFGQEPRSVETWNITTLRAGAALKFGAGKRVTQSKNTQVSVIPLKATDSKVEFEVNAPANIPAARTVRETFPVLNYVFFDLGSSKISSRYVLLKKDEVKNFKAEQVELYTPANLSGRSDRQMAVYYNILNILGDRMGKNPSSKITLVGSSKEGAADGRAMAESVKFYLVDVFAIDASRISIEGRDKPKIPTEKPGSTEELALLRQEDRRVSIESNSPSLLIEFQSGPNAPLKPVEIVNVQEAPVESYVTFNNKGASKEFTSWNLEIKNEDGTTQYFGPYTQEKIAIPGKSIMGKQPKGDYEVVMTGTTKDGKTVEKKANVQMVLWTPAQSEEAMRFSITYEFNESSAIEKHKTYLTEVVMPKIPRNGKVIIHGYTDNIGDAAYNQTLAQARANDVKSILQKALANAGRSDVKLEAHGYGEDSKLSPFDNKYPEGRSYNRAVLIDIFMQ